MTITCKLFAILRDKAGVAELSLELPEGASVSAAAQVLGEKFPALRDHLPRVAFAVNREYVSRDAPLGANDELALIPPVSGGST